MKFSPPERLDATHDLAGFTNGRHPVLDDWLRDALRRDEDLTARTFVVCERGTRRVVGYYALSTGGIRRDSIPTAKLRKGLSDPVPVVLVARLAVDRGAAGQGLGSSLVRDALARILGATRDVAASAVVVHAIDDDASAFYRKHGFLDSPIDARTMVLPIKMLRRGLS